MALTHMFVLTVCPILLGHILTWRMRLFRQWTKAMKVQGFSRDDLVYKSCIQPWGAYYALVATTFLMLANGYVGASKQKLTTRSVQGHLTHKYGNVVFLKGYWSTETFVFSYMYVAIDYVRHVID